MPPRRTSVKKSDNMPSQHSSRLHPIKQHRNTVADDELDVDMDSNEADMSTATQADSQNAPDRKLQQLMHNVIDSQRKRHTTRKQGIRKAYTASKTAARSHIRASFDDCETQLFTAYDAQLARLKDLLTKKAAIETAMEEKVGGLHKRYLHLAKCLDLVVEHRLKQLR